MYDGGKIITGLVIFVALVTFPFWGNLGSAAYERPTLEKPADAKECIESAEFMRSEHMQVLNQWRDWVVRDAKRIWTNSKGRQFNMSLTKTCMGCHTEKAKFCDRCHDSLSVKPYCWECHLTEPPKGNS